jgi:hypothetical protein
MSYPFPKTALLALGVGLAIIIGIVLLSFSPFLTGTTEVQTIAEAEAIVNQYIAGEPLQIEEVMEFSNHFYVIVQESATGVNAFELLVDRSTGRITSEPGPNHMWNRKYGHMYQDPNADSSMTIDPETATGYAQNWLDVNQPGATVEEAKAFYGYYTMDVSRHGQIYGMLSVNGYTGEVWYHTWHGEFIRMEEH